MHTIGSTILILRIVSCSAVGVALDVCGKIAAVLDVYDTFDFCAGASCSDSSVKICSG